jgi:hypothetical protein
MSNETKHTKEPWVESDGSVYAECQLDSDGMTYEMPIVEASISANARRIVACVNYCAGMPDEILNGVTAMQVYEAGNRRMEEDMERISSLEAQLAELSADNASMKKACDDFNLGKYKQLEAQLVSAEYERNKYATELMELEAQLEKLSGKTGYCEQCEWSGRENKERQAFYVRKIKEYQAQNKELREALQEAASVIRSINAGNDQKIIVDGDPMYRQCEEWVRWAIDEILPVVEKALSGGG